jgi:hypothetical protein
MAKSSSSKESLADRMRGVHIHPAVLVVIAVVLVVGIGYTTWLKPKMEADKALRDFNSPEAQAKRDPDQRQTSASLQAKIEAMRAKETHLEAGAVRRSGRRSE